jgi:hypothetical protein
MDTAKKFGEGADIDRRIGAGPQDGDTRRSERSAGAVHLEVCRGIAPPTRG